MEELGIPTRIVPFPPEKMYEPMPLPEKYTVGVYLPYDNKEFYYPDLVMEVAKEMKDVEWKIFGDPTARGKQDNIEHMGRVDNEEKDNMIKDCSCLLRLTRHDGLPLTVIEFATAGRQVVTSVEVKHGIQTKPEKNKVIAAIRKAMKGKENKEGSVYYKKLCDPKRYNERIYELMDYDPKKYWDNRADLWDRLEGNEIDGKEKYIVMNELNQLKAKSVLDIGCGNGLWSSEFKEQDYCGIDISNKLIKRAQKKHKGLDFRTLRVEDVEQLGKKFDVIFSYTCLLHIKPEEFEEAIKPLKKVAKYLMLIEPTVEPDYRGKSNRQLHPEAIKEVMKGSIVWGPKSSFVHDYYKHFEIIKKIDLGARTLMICKL